MVVRYQAGPPQGPQLLDPQGLRGLSVPAALMGLGGGMAPQGSLQGPMGAMGSIPLPQASLGSLGSLGSAGPGGPLEGVVRHSSLPALTNPSSLGSGLGQGHSDPGEAASQLPQACMKCRCGRCMCLWNTMRRLFPMHGSARGPCTVTRPETIRFEWI